MEFFWRHGFTYCTSVKWSKIPQTGNTQPSCTVKNSIKQVVNNGQQRFLKKNSNIKLKNGLKQSIMVLKNQQQSKNSLNSQKQWKGWKIERKKKKRKRVNNGWYGKKNKKKTPPKKKRKFFCLKILQRKKKRFFFSKVFSFSRFTNCSFRCFCLNILNLFNRVVRKNKRKKYKH